MKLPKVEDRYKTMLFKTNIRLVQIVVINKLKKNWENKLFENA